MTGPVQCVACVHFTLRDVGEIARQGCGRCAHDAPHSYYPAMHQRRCGKYELAGADVVEKRKEWLSARN